MGKWRQFSLSIAVHACARGDTKEYGASGTHPAYFLTEGRSDNSAYLIRSVCLQLHGEEWGIYLGNIFS